MVLNLGLLLPAYLVSTLVSYVANGGGGLPELAGQVLLGLVIPFVYALPTMAYLIALPTLIKRSPLSSRATALIASAFLPLSYIVLLALLSWPRSGVRLPDIAGVLPQVWSALIVLPVAYALMIRLPVRRPA